MRAISYKLMKGSYIYEIRAKNNDYNEREG